MNILSRLILLIFISNFSILAQNNGVNLKHKGVLKRCSTVEYEQSLQKKYSKRLNTTQFENWINPLISKHQLNRNEIGGIIIIPVVVHVVHSGQNIGSAPNIDDLQVQSQIDVLNNDFRKKIGTPGYNINPVGSDTQIQFALAQEDPNGNPTNGIDRVYFNKDNWTQGEIEEILKPETIWDPSLYLNMWTVNFSDKTLLGYAQFPDASGLPGLDSNGGLGSTDGVVSNYVNFGSRLIYPNGLYADNKYDKGRTMTHEVGHWVGLRHIWGDEACGDDYCADTPTAHGENYNCPNVVDCNNIGNEMVENYMDYTDDSCMNIFTLNQKDRMAVIMNNAIRRKSIKTSTKDQPISLFANDAELKIEKELTGYINSCQISNNPIKKITITNRGTTLLTNVLINYNINNGANQTYNWSGSLLTNQSETFDIELSANIDDIVNFNIVQTNGVADQRNTNNSASSKILPFQTPSILNFDEITFKLQLDKYGDEITWEFKNENGNILFSGGPYSRTQELPQLIEQKWQLKDNECYTFSIQDSFGDGVCCNEGEGFYELSYDDVIIQRGGNFGSAESKSFSVKFLNFELRGNPLINNELRFILDRSFGKNIICKVYNVSAKLVHSFPAVHSIEKIEDLSILQSGIYFLKIESEIKNITVKFIKL